MFEKIIALSMRNPLMVFILVGAIIAGGLWSLRNIAIDAVPDITNNQVQVVTSTPSLAAPEVEQVITFPLENKLRNIPNVEEVRSISRFGLSVITVVFREEVPQLDARQLVKEQIDIAGAEIPPSIGVPELMPITTGLGEIYQYVLKVEKGFEDRYNDMELRTIQDWVVKRQLSGTPGIIEISSFGGRVKQYEVAVDPSLLRQHEVTIAEVFDALESNNENSGGSYIERGPNAYYIRSYGRVESKDDIEEIVIQSKAKNPLRIRDIGTVEWGSPNRFGAMTMDGKGEVVGGIVLMLKGANSSEAIANVHRRVSEIQRTLPEGISIYGYLDRSVLVGKTISTVSKNLIEGGLIVVFVLVLMLGNFRAGLIVASVIPLSMLFALILMKYFGVSANLMSLGAIDFGIVVDGAVIIVESVLHVLHVKYGGQTLSRSKLREVVGHSAQGILQSAAFGVLIILIVFVPILSLSGIEGKMFRPMAQTVSFALLGALLLSLTYVPVIAAMTLKRKIHSGEGFSDRMIGFLKRIYQPVLEKVLHRPKTTISMAFLVFLFSIGVFSQMGGEFIPTLEEGDLAMQMTLKPGSSLTESVRATTQAQKIILENFPEVKHVVAKIGTAEIPTDPMAMEDCDVMIIMKEKEEWVSADNREGLIAMMKEKLSIMQGVNFEFTQPIQLRFNELMTGAKTDISIKIFGENMETLKDLADRSALIIQKIDGAGDVKVEQTEGIRQWIIRFDRNAIAYYGADISEINRIIRASFSGEVAGFVYENERKFDLVVRLRNVDRAAFIPSEILVSAKSGGTIPLNQLVHISEEEGPMLISREDAKRRINIGVNVRNRDVASLVAEIEKELQSKVKLPSGYFLKFGGQFENLQKAKDRLLIAVPIALAMIFILLYFAFGSVRYASLIYMAVPLSAIGGVFALWIRGMPFSISAGVGFIALFGVAVLNGIVLIAYYEQLKKEETFDLKKLIMEGSKSRLRPVLMTAAVASLGFIPMALSTGNGAEVQKPLATVVIGGLVSATLLTLLVLPCLYFVSERKRYLKSAGLLALIFIAQSSYAQLPVFTLDHARARINENHLLMKNSELQIEYEKEQKGQNRPLPPLELVMQYGQINYDRRDWYMESNQSLGNFASWFRMDQVMRRKIILAESQQSLLHRELLLRVSIAYTGWKYAWQEREMYDSLLVIHDRALKRMEKKMNSGGSDRSEYLLLSSRQASLRNEYSFAEMRLWNLWNELATLCMYSDSAVQPESVKSATFIIKPTSVLPELLSTSENAIEIQRAETALIRSAYSPELMIGYFRQSLENIGGYWGVRAGISIPLWAWTVRSKAEQSKIREQQLTNDLEWQRFQLAQQLNSLVRQSVVLSDALQRNGNDYLNDLEKLRMLAEKQYQSGAISFFDFRQMIDHYLRSRIDHVRLLNEYENLIHQIRFLTDNTY